jgi:hypothetical protein
LVPSPCREKLDVTVYTVPPGGVVGLAVNAEVGLIWLVGVRRGEEAAPGIENSIGMKLVLIETGKFTIGSPADEKGRTRTRGSARWRYRGHSTWESTK